MKRRDLILALGGAAASWPLAVRAQQPRKLPTIGFLGSGTPSTQNHFAAALMQRLHGLGWTQDRNIAIEYRWAEGRLDRGADILDELVRLKCDLIVIAGGANAVAAKQVTSVIPIVFVGAGDPEGMGLVSNLARPDGNITGLSPSELPVEQPTKFELVVNLTAAKAMGLAIPSSILLRADQVIE